MSDPNEISINSDDEPNPCKVEATEQEDAYESKPVIFKNENIESEVNMEGKKKIKIAVAGCSHGEMDKIYSALQKIEAENNFKYDLLICCGDFQAIRNFGDLAHMHVPDKYKSLQTFYKYYSGEKVAPILTVFVGGNHEGSGYLCELPYGGWVAPRIYYMGFSNTIRFAGLRIAGLSGIFKSVDFHKGHYERPPFEHPSELVSAYHVRNFDVWRLKHLRARDADAVKNTVDIMITHDWPCGITDFGDLDQLLRIKPFFREDIEHGRLGNPATMPLLYDIKPRYWFAAHLHVMFAALVPHKGKEGEPEPEPTRFLALDKPIPRRHFLQTVELEVDKNAPMKLEYDEGWLAILKSTNHLTETTYKKMHMPSVHSIEERFDFRPTDEELEVIKALGDLTIPENFNQTAPPIKELTPEMGQNIYPSLYYKNPQTTEFCRKFEIADINKILVDSKEDGVGVPSYLTCMDDADVADANEIRIDDDVFDDEDFVIDTRPTIDSSSLESNTYLDDFKAPKWGGSSSTTTASEEVEFKRRKVDFTEDE